MASRSAQPAVLVVSDSAPERRAVSLQLNAVGYDAAAIGDGARMVEERGIAG